MYENSNCSIGNYVFRKLCIFKTVLNSNDLIINYASSKYSVNV